jgi:hypothetical protein
MSQCLFNKLFDDMQFVEQHLNCHIIWSNIINFGNISFGLGAKVNIYIGHLKHFSNVDGILGQYNYIAVTLNIYLQVQNQTLCYLQNQTLCYFEGYGTESKIVLF